MRGESELFEVDEKGEGVLGRTRGVLKEFGLPVSLMRREFQARYQIRVP